MSYTPTLGTLLQTPIGLGLLRDGSPHLVTSQHINSLRGYVVYFHCIALYSAINRSHTRAGEQTHIPAKALSNFSRPACYPTRAYSRSHILSASTPCRVAQSNIAAKRGRSSTSGSVPSHGALGVIRVANALRILDKKTNRTCQLTSGISHCRSNRRITTGKKCTPTSLVCTSPLVRIFLTISSSFVVPNSFSSCCLLAVFRMPCFPCLFFWKCPC